MATRAMAENGGQAAIGDIHNTTVSSLIGQISGNNTIVIQHLHITSTLANTPEDYPMGMIGFFGLDGWWLQTLSEEERATIECAIGDDVCKASIYSTSQSAQGWLRSIAWRIGALHQQLASKLRAKAAGLETGIEIDDYWLRQFDNVRKHWQRLDFDSARSELRSVGYRMREENALPEARAAFDTLLAELMRADPYYIEVMAAVLPVIKKQPGTIQAELAKEFSFDIEQFRHAMYYGEVIGDIKRVKAGRSYRLYPVE